MLNNLCNRVGVGKADESNHLHNDQFLGGDLEINNENYNNPRVLVLTYSLFIYV